MSKDSPVLCGPCGFEHVTKTAKKWCSNCGEGFCEECEKVHRATKMSRAHQLISISDYMQMQNISISQTCTVHQKKYDWYCKVHDMPLCVSCVPNEHKTCSDVISLHDAAKNAKCSTAFTDVEDTIDGAIQNVQKFVNTSGLAIDDFYRQEVAIKQTIKETRNGFNKHLDELEQNLLVDLTKKKQTCKSKYNENQSQMQLSAERLSQFKHKTTQMKEYASEMQVFLGTRQIKKSVDDEINTLMSGSPLKYRITLEINPKLKSFFKDVDHLGKIKIEETSRLVEFTDPKIGQAQMQVHLLPPNICHNVQLHLEREFIISKEGTVVMAISGCTVLPSGHLLVADNFGKPQLMEYTGDGRHVRNIPTWTVPFDVTVIDSTRIAVTYGYSECVEIIRLQDNNVEKKTLLENNCFGVTYQKGRIYCVVFGKGIVVMNLSGETLDTITLSNSLSVYYITSTENRLYYTDSKAHQVYCCSMSGEVVWVFQDERIVNPTGLSIDGNQNIFVVGKISENIVLIQNDGKDSKILGTPSQNLDKPNVICYDKRRLLVCEENSGFSRVYKVTN